MFACLWIQSLPVIIFVYSFALVLSEPSKLIYQDHRVEKRQANNDQSTDANKTVEDNHFYYKSKIMPDPQGYYWNELNDGQKIKTLSNHSSFLLHFYRMPFNFTYYGHKIDIFAITTRGFLYVSDFLHPDLDWTFTHYIAPLMGKYHTIGDDSHILYKADENSIVVEWRNVTLTEQPENGQYTFQTTLFKNGTIIFGYKSVPSTNITGKVWPTTIGISDAFYFDVEDVLGDGGHVRIIARYHAVNLDVTKLADNTVIILEPLPTCIQQETCENCTTLVSAFECSWCDALSRCSDGIDRHRQEWLTSSCNKNAKNMTDQCWSTNAMNQKSDDVGSKTTLVIAVTLAVMAVIILVFVGLWIYYARTHPNSKSGLWLIEHSPRRLKEKLSEMKASKNSNTPDIGFSNSTYNVADRDVGEINVKI